MLFGILMPVSFPKVGKLSTVIYSNMLFAPPPHLLFLLGSNYSNIIVTFLSELYKVCIVVTCGTEISVQLT